MIIIYYTGIGSKKNGRHTSREFLNIMYHYFRDRDWNNCSQDEKNIKLVYKDYILPDEFQFFTLDDWVQYSGATIL